MKETSTISQDLEARRAANMVELLPLLREAVARWTGAPAASMTIARRYLDQIDAGRVPRVGEVLVVLRGLSAVWPLGIRDEKLGGRLDAVTARCRGCGDTASRSRGRACLPCRRVDRARTRAESATPAAAPAAA